MEGPEITRFACESCHNVGKPAADGSVGQCQKCHSRHEFSLEQARKPETCNNCHIGPDHPQWEIYFESKHGIKYSTDGQNWNWEAEPGTQMFDSGDLPAVTAEGFDDPEIFDAYLDAVRWGAITNADSKALQSPFRSGIAIQDHQLAPLARALAMARVSLPSRP